MDYRWKTDPKAAKADQMAKMNHKRIERAILKRVRNGETRANSPKLREMMNRLYGINE